MVPSITTFLCIKSVSLFPMAQNEYNVLLIEKAYASKRTASMPVTLQCVDFHRKDLTEAH
uniref:Uncharacterized protein n=1 Tax=Anguilla anguilla TaxID=7936 RepID=A0A0E9PUE0_ANGAN